MKNSKVIELAIKTKDKELHRESIVKMFEEMREIGLIDEVEKLLNTSSGKVLLSNSFRLIRDRKQLLISHINKENNCR